MISRNEVVILAIGEVDKGLTDHLKYLVYEFFHSERIDCVVMRSKIAVIEDRYTLINLKVAVDVKTSQYELSNLEKHIMRDSQFIHAQYIMLHGKVNIVKWLIFRMGKYLDQKRERLERGHIQRIKAGSSLDTEAALEARLAERKASETASGMTVQSAKTKIDLVNEKIAEERKAKKQAKKQAEKEEKEKLKKEEKQRKREEQKAAKKKLKEERKAFLKAQEEQKAKEDAKEPKVEEPKKEEPNKEEPKGDEVKKDDSPKVPTVDPVDKKDAPNGKPEKEEKADGSDESKGEDSRE